MSAVQCICVLCIIALCVAWRHYIAVGFGAKLRSRTRDYGGELRGNVQIMIVSAVKIYKQCLHTASASGGRSTPTEASKLAVVSYRAPGYVPP